MRYSNFSKSHRILALFDKCINRPNNIVFSSEIAEEWDCNPKTAKRLIRYIVEWARNGSFFQAKEIRGSVDPKGQDQIGIFLKLK